MVSNNSLNQASEAMVIGPIGVAASDPIQNLLQVQKDQAANTSATVTNATSNAAASAALQLVQQMSTGLGASALILVNDLFATTPAIAGKLVLQTNPSAASVETGVYIWGKKATDSVTVGIGTTAVTQAIWTSTGGQYRGNNTNVVPPAGYLGEVLSATATTGSLTISTTTNVTSVSLTAGIWDVFSYCAFNTTGTVAGNTVWNSAVSLANNNLTGIGENGNGEDGGKLPVNAVNSVAVIQGPTRVTLSATTTIYLNCRGFASTTFTSVTCTGKVRAVRVG